MTTRFSKIKDEINYSHNDMGYLQNEAVHDLVEIKSQFKKIEALIKTKIYNPSLQQEQIFYMVRERNFFFERMAWLMTKLIIDKKKALSLYYDNLE